MSTIKSPQNNFSRNGRGNSRFIIFLLLITWVVIASGFYGIKSGMIGAEAVDPALNERFTTLEGKITALDGRITDLETKLAAMQTPTSANPAEPGTPDAAKTPENGAAVPSATDPIPTAPGAAAPAEEKKEEVPGKPQTNNASDNANHAALEEKKSQLIAAN